MCLSHLFHTYQPFVYWQLLNVYFGKQWNPDEMPYKVDLHCLLRQNNLQQKEIQYHSGNITQYIQLTIPSSLHQIMRNKPFVYKYLTCWCFTSQSPIFQFSFMSGCVPVYLGWTSTKLRIKCLAQGHNAASLVSLKPATPWSQVQHSYHWATVHVL